MRQYEKFLCLTFIAAVSAASVTACNSDDDSGSGSKLVSSIDSSKAMNRLSDDEAKKYCAEMSHYTTQQLSSADTKKIACGIAAQIVGGPGASSNADARKKCGEAYDKCMNRTDEPDEVPEEDLCTNFEAKFSDCTATVGEVNECLADQAKALKALAGKDICSEAKATSSNQAASTSLEKAIQPATCKAIESRCPGLSGSSKSS